MITLNKQYAQQEELINLHNKQLQNKQFTDALLTENEHLQAITGVINHYKTEIITLNGPKNEPENSFQLYVNPTKKQAVLFCEQAPKIAVNELFQLWGVNEHKDTMMLGLFDSGELALTSEPFQVTPTVSRFFITKEPQGGSERPRLENLVAVPVYLLLQSSKLFQMPRNSDIPTDN